MTSDEHMCRTFAEVLGITPVAADDNFFDLGGHSLLAVQLLKQIQTDFGVKPTLRTVYQNPTPAELAGHVRQA